MNYKIFSLPVVSAFFLLCQPGFAQDTIETLQSRIVKYSPAPDSQSEAHFYLETEGRVARVAADQPGLSEKLETAFFKDEIVTVSLKDMGDHDEVVALETAPAPVASFLEVGTEPSDLATDATTLNYVPSDLGTFERANGIFAGLHNRFTRRSECFQRAHIWAYQMSRVQINSMKVFLFFTEKYIRGYNYKWWFHVAPFVYVDGVQHVMDRSFTAKPLVMQEWTNHFMKNRAVCPTIRTYSDYSRNEYAAYCFLAKLPMYYYNPLDLQRLERGIELTEFQTSHLNNARRAVR